MNDQESPQEPQTTLPSIEHYFGAVKTGRHYWWHWLTGVCLMLLIFLAMLISLAVVFGLCEDLIDFNLTVVDGQELANLVVLLLSFLVAFVAIAVIQKFWHRRPVAGLITSAKKFRWGNCCRAMVVFLFWCSCSILF